MLRPKREDRIFDRLQRHMGAAMWPATAIYEALWPSFVITVDPAIGCWARDSIPGEGVSFTADLRGTQLAFGLGEIERAAAMAAALPASYERTALLVRCSRDLDTLESAQNALHSFQELSETDQARIA